MNHPKIPTITIDLYYDQMAAMAPMMEKVEMASDGGSPGFLCAQIFSRSMKVFFLDHATALEFQKIMNQEVGKTT